MANIGFVGLGVMGSGMVKRLLDAGHAVFGYNRTRSKADWLVDRGMHRADSPGDAARAGEVVISMVANSDALNAVASGDDGVLSGLSSGTIYVDMSTVSPSISRELAQQVTAKGAHMLDAPVSGSITTLAQGNLSIMVGGDRTAYERVKPILQDIGPTVDYVGKNGLAVTMKIATNLSLAVQMLAGHFHLAFITHLVLAAYIPSRLWWAGHGLPERSTAPMRSDTSRRAPMPCGLESMYISPGPRGSNYIYIYIYIYP